MCWSRAGTMAGRIATTSRRSSSEYAAFLKTSPDPTAICATTRRCYRQPHSVMPPHGAPLGMLYYEAEKFPALKDKLIVVAARLSPDREPRARLRHRRARLADSRVAPPVRYNVSCAASEVFAENGKPIPAAPYTELVSGWHRVDGVRPQGAPVGMTVAADGALWLVEDKNQTIIRIDSEPEQARSARSPAARGRRRRSPISRRRVMQGCRQPQAPGASAHATDRTALHRLPCRLRHQAPHERGAEGRRRAALPASRRTAGFSPAIPQAAVCTIASGARAPKRSCRPTAGN